MKRMLSSLLICLGAVLVHVNHDDNKSTDGEFHFGPVTGGNNDSQPNKDQV